MDDEKKPFWQEFCLKICECVGIDPKSEIVSGINIEIMPGCLPEITVKLSPYTKQEWLPITETFVAAEWRNTRAEKIYQGSFERMTQAERQRLYEILHKRFDCKIYGD